MSKLYMMIGLSGSGKSTYAEKIAKANNCKIFSFDNIRKELYGDESIQENHNKVFKILHGRIKEHLTNGYNVIYDATNLTCKYRKAFLKEINNINCYKIAVVVSTPYTKCISNDMFRNRTIGKDVIDRQIRLFQCPYYFEGWDEIVVYNTMYETIPYVCKLLHWTTIPHDNPHHKESIGTHMLNCYNEMKKRTNNIVLQNAAIFHDCGKPFTKAPNSKHPEFCSYYNHNNVGAYNFLTYKNDLSMRDRVHISALITYHMQKYLCSDMEKFYQEVGDDFAEELKLLNECDKVSAVQE